MIEISGEVNSSRSQYSSPSAAFFLLCCSRAFSPFAAIVLQRVCVRGVRRRLASMAGAQMVDHIIGLLRPQEVVLAGSVVWSGLIQEMWVSSDIDIFLTHAQVEIVAAALTSVGFAMKSSITSYPSQVVGGQLARPPLSYWKSAIWYVRTYLRGTVRIDLVVVSHGIQEALARFDLCSCGCHYDGSKVHIVDPGITFAKKTRVCARRLALLNAFSASVAEVASGRASCYLSPSTWFSGLEAGVLAVRRAGFDPADCRELVDALVSDDISLTLCGYVRQLNGCISVHYIVSGCTLLHED